MDDASAPAASDTVPITVYVPRQVAEWLDKRRAGVFKSRSRYIRDLLVSVRAKDVNGGAGGQ